MDDAPSRPDTSATRPQRRWKRILKRTAIVFAVLLLLTALALEDYIRTLRSLRRIPGTNAYVMDYYVDYNMAEIRAHGLDVNHIEDSLVSVYFPKWMVPIGARLRSVFLRERIATIPAGEHCSTVVLHANDGHVYFGRNFDYCHDTCLILKVHATDGPSSVAVLDLHYLNLDRADLDQTNLFQRIPLLFAPYYLQDGMNRYGVAVSDMSVDGVQPPRDPDKPNIIHSAAMRLILDYAHSTAEAIEILKQFNIYFVAESCHLMIADATGKSEVVEFIGGELKPTTMAANWQICTNHQLYGKTPSENCQRCSRFKQASAELTDLHDKAGPADVMNIMQSVSKSNWTMWSSVYDLTTGDFRMAYRQQYDQPYIDHLSE